MRERGRENVNMEENSREARRMEKDRRVKEGRPQGLWCECGWIGRGRKDREKRRAVRRLCERNKEAGRAEPGSGGAADGATETESAARVEQARCEAWPPSPAGFRGKQMLTGSTWNLVDSRPSATSSAASLSLEGQTGRER